MSAGLFRIARPVELAGEYQTGGTRASVDSLGACTQTICLIIGHAPRVKVATASLTLVTPTCQDSAASLLTQRLEDVDTTRVIQGWLLPAILLRDCASPATWRMTRHRRHRHQSRSSRRIKALILILLRLRQYRDHHCRMEAQVHLTGRTGRGRQRVR